MSEIKSSFDELLAGGWRITALDPRHGRLRVTIARGEQTAVIGMSARQPGEDAGAFGDATARCWYEGRGLDRHELEAPAKQALALFSGKGALTSSGLNQLARVGITTAEEAEHRPLLAANAPAVGTRLVDAWAISATTTDGRAVFVALESITDNDALHLRFSVADSPDPGPFGRDGIRIEHRGESAPATAGDAAHAWLQLLDELSPAPNRRAALAALTGDPSTAGLASAIRRLRLQPVTDADVTDASRLIEACNADVTARIEVVVSAPTSVQTTHRQVLEAALPAGIKLRLIAATPKHQPLTPSVGMSTLPAELDAVPRKPSRVDTTADGAGDWQQRARSLLLDRPDVSVRVRDLVPETEIPDWPCALPWTRFEISPSGWFGPCCRDYQATHQRLDRNALPDQSWNGDAMQAFRAAMTSKGHPQTCRTSCPFLNAGNQRPADVRVHGGHRAHVENAILVIEDLLRGATVMRGRPLEVCIAATTFCNYDCLMCDYGETGTLDDELPRTFWEGLRQTLQTTQFLEVNGGEPLGSPVFRDFLATIDSRITPQLRILLISNGSYLGPKQIAKYQDVPFENITLSINAATGPTYEKVNRGLSWQRAWSHLEAIKDARTAGRLQGRVQYSMVLLKQNIDEIELFEQLATAHNAAVRYQLPLRDRNNSSIMTDRTMMLTAMQRLDKVAAKLLAAGRYREARGAAGNAQVLWRRAAARVIAPL